MKRLFGTDGIRGVANTELTAAFALDLGAAAAQVFGAGSTIVIGRDPRRSGDLLESAFVAGVLSQGADMLALGVVPTPGVSFAVRQRRAAAGVVISASHNPMPDNGIKFFGPDGHKLPDAAEDAIAAALDRVASRPMPRPHGAGIGRLVRDSAPVAEYATFLTESIAPYDLAGMTLVVDAANGSGSFLARPLLEGLGARVIALHDAPDGLNINAGCGSLHPESMASAVVAHGADAGLALDGDADRVILADGQGRIFDGDRILCTVGLHLAGRGGLPGEVVVGTVMSNLGLEKALGARGIRLLRASVGDRYVAELLAQSGAVVGGEQSGHILFPRLAPAGDGLLTGLQLLRIVRESGRSLAEWADEMATFPQTLINIPVAEHDGWEHDPTIQAAIAEADTALAGRGRLLVRPSGTEKLLRVMVEAEDDVLVGRWSEQVAAAIRKARGA